LTVSLSRARLTVFIRACFFIGAYVKIKQSREAVLIKNLLELTLPAFILRKMKKLLLKIKENVALKNYTTFKIGGNAKYFFEVKDKNELILATKMAKENSLPFFILGGGSNVLISDKGYDGLVIKMQNTDYKILDTEIYVEAGVRLGKIVNLSNEAALSGLEWMAGIPGTIGGAIRGNAGAFEGETKDIIKEVEFFDVKDGKIKIFKNKDCEFGYRNSIFKKNQNLIILSAVIQLKKGNKDDIKEKAKKYITYRIERHPNNPSAGSLFKNYTGSKLLKKYPETEKFNKMGFIPAGWLIEKVGLKGFKIGGAQISEKHCNFIINTDNGKAKDVIDLINLVKEKVKNEFGIIIEEEIQYLK